MLQREHLAGLTHQVAGAHTGQDYLGLQRSNVLLHLWRSTYRWALRTHPNKTRRWVVDRYFGMFNPSRRDRWIFGDRDSGIYLRRFAWTKIVCHQLVMGTASPDDPALDQYWARRRRTSFSLLGGLTASLLLRQQGRCPVCGTFLLHAEHGPQSPREWEQWTRTLTRAQECPRAGQHPSEIAGLGAPVVPIYMRIEHPVAHDRPTP